MLLSVSVLLFLFLLLRCVGNLDGYSHLTFLGHTGSCFSVNSLGKSVCFCLAALSSGHQEVEGSPPLEAICLPPRVCLTVPAEPHLESGIGLSRAPAGFSGHQVRHLRLFSSLSPILRYLTSIIFFGEENVSPKSNLHPRLPLFKSRGVQGLLEPLVFSYPLPPGSLLSTWSAYSVLVSCYLTPHPNFTTAPHYIPHFLLGLWCGALSDYSRNYGATLSGIGFFGKLTSLWNLHPPGKGLDSQKAASRDGLRSLCPICRPPSYSLFKV